MLAQPPFLVPLYTCTTIDMCPQSVSAICLYHYMSVPLCVSSYWAPISIACWSSVSTRSCTGFKRSRKEDFKRSSKEGAINVEGLQMFPQILNTEYGILTINVCSYWILTWARQRVRAEDANDVCWRMLTYADVCWHMRTHTRRARWRRKRRMLTCSDVCWHMRTYARRARWRRKRLES